MSGREKLRKISYLNSDYRQSEQPYRSKDLFQSHLFNDLIYKGLREYLRYEDRNSMAYSLESRLPFMDYRLVEWGFSLSERSKIYKGESKAVLRDVAKKYIPKEVHESKKKMGFVTPQEKWQRKELKPYLDEVFSNNFESKFSFINDKEVKKIYSDYASGQNNDWTLVWRLANLYEWQRSFVERDWKASV